MLGRNPRPFGKPFAYTDAADLKTPARRRYGRIDHTLDWYRSWWQRLTHRRPVGYVVATGEDDQVPTAHICLDRPQPSIVVGSRFIEPVYDEDLLLAVWHQLGILDDFDPAQYPAHTRRDR